MRSPSSIAIAAFLLVLLPGTAMVAGATQIRVATFNASQAQSSQGQLAAMLQNPFLLNPSRVAEIIQIVAPDIILINEFDYDEGQLAIRRFHDNFLATSQNGQPAQVYPHRFTAPSNTGIHSGFDLDNNGSIDDTPGDESYGNDAFGFGEFPGKFGMAVYSKYPIDTEGIRTVRNFLWKDMPGAVIPPGFYSADEFGVFRLSSKSHWDIPINVDGQVVHLLASHPTPPVFDGPEDKNGRRNHDEIRLWADYLSPNSDDYIYDDAGVFGGLGADKRFVVVGDQNADPNSGDSFNSAVLQLLDHPAVDASIVPRRTGQPVGGGSEHTATFNLRADYVLPSKTGFANLGGAVFWPEGAQTGTNLLGVSDHRLVYMDLELIPVIEEAVRGLSIERTAGEIILRWSFQDGAVYGVERTMNLEAGAWSEPESVQIALDTDAGVATATDVSPSDTVAYYRVTAALQ